jgi:hypothetical protein
MEIVFVLLFLLLAGPLALLYGEDSRFSDERGWWPGSRRRNA